MPIGNTNFHIKINVPELFIISVSIVFCEFNGVASWKEDKSIILVRSSIQISKKKYWFHILGQWMSM